MVREFTNAFEKILAQEGGWKLTENSNDPGGMTFGGMTYSTYVAWERSKNQNFPSPQGFKACAVMIGQPNDNLKALITQAYRDLFWDKLDLDNTFWGNWPRDLIFSCAVNCGTNEALSIVQQMCAVAVDGVLGEITRMKIDEKNQLSYETLAIEFKRLWRMYYLNLVVKNMDEWEDYTKKVYASQNSFKEPVTKSWKFLRGWINRVDQA